MKICLVAAFPPSARQLNEYAFYLAGELQRNPDISLTILADELTDYEFATDENGKSLNGSATGGAAGLRRDPLLEVQQPGHSGAFVKRHPQIEARRGVVQPRLLKLWHSGIPGGGLCGTVDAGY